MTSAEAIAGIGFAIIAGIVLYPAFAELHWPDAFAVFAEAFRVQP